MNVELNYKLIVYEKYLLYFNLFLKHQEGLLGIDRLKLDLINYSNTGILADSENRKLSNIYTACINDIIDTYDILGLAEGSTQPAVPQSVKDFVIDKAIDAAGKLPGQAGEAAQALKLLKKAIDAKRKIEDPNNDEALKDIEKKLNMFIYKPSFDNCMDLCQTMVAYFQCNVMNAVHFCEQHCESIMDKINK